jgi:hypothetical protein
VNIIVFLNGNILLKLLSAIIGFGAKWARGINKKKMTFSQSFSNLFQSDSRRMTSGT